MHVPVHMYVHITHGIVYSSRSADWASTRYGYQFCSWSAEQGENIFPYPTPGFEPDNLVARDGLGRPRLESARSLSTPTLNLVLVHGIPPAFRRGAHLYRQPSSRQFRVYQVPEVSTDGVYCRESATMPVVLYVARVAGAKPSGPTFARLSFSIHTTIVLQWPCVISIVHILQQKRN